jgi:hypothetical protein
MTEIFSDALLAAGIIVLAFAVFSLAISLRNCGGETRRISGVSRDFTGDRPNRKPTGAKGMHQRISLKNFRFAKKRAELKGKLGAARIQPCG